MIEYRVAVKLLQLEPDSRRTVESTRLSRQMIHGETMTVARLRLRKGAVVPLHQHVNEQISMVEHGRLRFVIAGEERILSGAATW